MPSLNFQPRFAPLVESGEKRQTIRARRKDARDPKPGDVLHLYTGMRTKKCRKLGEAKCLSVVPIRFEWGSFGHGASLFRAFRGSRRIPARALAEIAHADGFRPFAFPSERAIDDLFQWFKLAHGLPFEGLVIRW